MNATIAYNRSKELRAEFPTHTFQAVQLTCPVYQCPASGRLKKLHTEGQWGIEMDGTPYGYPPRPDRPWNV